MVATEAIHPRDTKRQMIAFFLVTSGSNAKLEVQRRKGKNIGNVIRIRRRDPERLLSSCARLKFRVHMYKINILIIII